MESSWLYLPSSECIQLNITDGDVQFCVSSLLAKHQLPVEDYYVVCNGRRTNISDVVCGGCCYRIQPRLPGGKGGFGSMLRALGAQIEKTTNREACRDLSGRRMRDVNNEKKLRDWAAKAGEREQAREEKRRERRERIKAAVVARHKYSDPEYDQQKVRIAEELDEALREALKKGSTSSSSAEATACCSKELRKRKAQSACADEKMYDKKAHEWIGVDDADLSSSSSSSGEEEMEMVNQDHQEDENGDESSSSSSRSKEEADNILTETESSSSCTAVKTITEVETERNIDSNLNTASSINSSDDSTSQEPARKEKPLVETPLPIKLEDFESAKVLEKLGLDVLKAELMDRGLKCGGTLEQRAQRLFSVKGLSADQIDKALFAKPPGKK